MIGWDRSSCFNISFQLESLDWLNNDSIQFFNMIIDHVVRLNYLRNHDQMTSNFPYLNSTFLHLGVKLGRSVESNSSTLRPFLLLRYLDIVVRDGRFITMIKFLTALKTLLLHRLIFKLGHLWLIWLALRSYRL